MANLILCYASSKLNSFTPHTLSIHRSFGSRISLLTRASSLARPASQLSCHARISITDETRHISVSAVSHRRTNRALWGALCIHKASMWSLRRHRGFHIQLVSTHDKDLSDTLSLFLTLLYFHYCIRQSACAGFKRDLRIKRLSFGVMTQANSNYIYKTLIRLSIISLN